MSRSETRGPMNARPWPQRLPWSDEPDKVEWLDEDTEFPCCITRHQVLGHLCGYVGLTRYHPCYGRSDFAGMDVPSHHGITFTGHVHLSSEERLSSPSCRYAAEPADTLWWVGFDCGHLSDLQPGMLIYNAVFGDGIYRDLPYVEQVVTDMARYFAGFAAIVPKIEVKKPENYDYSARVLRIRAQKEGYETYIRRARALVLPKNKRVLAIKRGKISVKEGENDPS